MVHVGFIQHLPPWICLSPFSKTLCSLCRNIFLYSQRVPRVKWPSGSYEQWHRITHLVRFHVTIKCATETAQTAVVIKPSDPSARSLFAQRQTTHTVEWPGIQSWALHLRFHLIEWFSDGWLPSCYWKKTYSSKGWSTFQYLCIYRLVWRAKTLAQASAVFRVD